MQFSIQFGEKVLSQQQQGYAQVKWGLWGIVSAMKVDKNYLIGTKVTIETDLTMFKWIVYIKSLSRKIRHICRKENAMADMLLRARFKGEDDMV